MAYASRRGKKRDDADDDDDDVSGDDSDDDDSDDDEEWRCVMMIYNGQFLHYISCTPWLGKQWWNIDLKPNWVTEKLQPRGLN